MKAYRLPSQYPREQKIFERIKERFFMERMSGWHNLMGLLSTNKCCSVIIVIMSKNFFSLLKQNKSCEEDNHQLWWDNAILCRVQKFLILSTMLLMFAKAFACFLPLVVFSKKISYWIYQEIFTLQPLFQYYIYLCHRRRRLIPYGL